MKKITFVFLCCIMSFIAVSAQKTEKKSNKIDYSGMKTGGSLTVTAKEQGATKENSFGIYEINIIYHNKNADTDYKESNKYFWQGIPDESYSITIGETLGNFYEDAKKIGLDLSEYSNDSFPIVIKFSDGNVCRIDGGAHLPVNYFDKTSIRFRNSTLNGREISTKELLRYLSSKEITDISPKMEPFISIKKSGPQVFKELCHALDMYSLEWFGIKPLAFGVKTRTSSHLNPKRQLHKTPFMMGGKRVTMYWMKDYDNTDPSDKTVSNIFIVPDGYEGFSDFVKDEDINMPPCVHTLILHDIPGKEWLEAVVYEVSKDSEGVYSYHRYGVSLPEDVANEIIDLLSGDTPYSMGLIYKLEKNKSTTLTPQVDINGNKVQRSTSLPRVLPK